MVCKKCGSDMGEDYKGKFCAECGEPLDYVVIVDDEENEEPPKKVRKGFSKKKKSDSEKSENEEIKESEEQEDDLNDEEDSNSNSDKKPKKVLRKSYSKIVFILGIAGLCLSCVFIGIIPAIIAIVLGIMELTSRRKKMLTVVGMICATGAVILFMISTVFILGFVSREEITTVDNVQQQNVEDVVTNVLEEYEQPE